MENCLVFGGPILKLFVPVTTHGVQGGLKGWDGIELTTHFFDHGHGCTSNGTHCHRREDKGQHGSNKQACNHIGLGDIDACNTRRRHVGSKQGQSRQGRRCNGKTFPNCGGCVPYRVQFVGTLTNFFGEFTHFGNTSGVIRNRAVSIHRQLNTGIGQHPHGSNSDPVQTPKMKGPDNAGRNQQNRNSSGHHSHPKTSNNIGRSSRRGLTYDGQDRLLPGSGIVFGDKSHEYAGNQSNNGCIKNTHRGIVIATLWISPSVQGIFEPPFGGQHPRYYKVGGHNHEP